MDETERLDLAAAVRDLCLQELLEAYEQAGMSGLCAEGRWEVAVGRVRALKAAELVERVGRDIRHDGTKGTKATKKHEEAP